MRLKSSTLPENIRKCMDAGVRKQCKCFTQDEIDSKLEKKAEKSMHGMFIKWLLRNDVLFVHCRMDKKPTITKGWPDFTLFKNGFMCAVEFKVLGKKPTDDQAACIARLQSNGIPVMVCNSYSDAVRFAISVLEMNHRID